MSISKRVVSVLLCLIMVSWVAVTGITYTDEEETQVATDHNSIILWYSDEGLSGYLSAMAVAYNERYGVRVLPKQVSADEYLENINEATLSGGDYPDLYVISNEMLEKAYLSGLASKIKDPDNAVTADNFSMAAVNAVTYKNKKVAYPFFFETSALLFNKTYLMERATNLVLAEEGDSTGEDGAKDGGEVTIDDTTGEVVSENTDETSADADLSQEERINLKYEEMIPKNFDELREFADEYDAPQQVETVFKWDVKDIFYNYFFAGDYMNLGGPCGDDSSNIDIYNKDAINALKVYQDLNQFFSFEYEEINYTSVIDEFIEGKIVFTTATSDIINTLDTAIKDGRFQYEYALAKMPELNQELTTKSLSVTGTIVVNGYSTRKEDANAVARFITVDSADELYGMTGKLSANKNVEYDNPNVEILMEEYADSASMPKMMATSNFWVPMELAFSKIWAGQSVSDNLKLLSEQIQTQVTGMEVSEEYIDLPDTSEEIEYYDEEAEREAAMQEGEEDKSEED